MDTTHRQIGQSPADSDAPQDYGHSRWRAVGRWSVRLVLALGGLIGLLVLPLAFTTTIVPPADLNDPVTVYLSDHGMTSSLALPSEDGGMIRYLYADWNYYALGNTGRTDTFWALFWPTTATLGRQQLAGASNAGDLRRQTRVRIVQLHSFEVERDAVVRVRGRLDALVDAQRDTLLFDEFLDMSFVHHPRAYTYFHNSNHVAADWLRELECQVRGPAYYSRWNVVAR